MFENNSYWIWNDSEKEDVFQFCYFRKKFLSQKKAIASIYCCADSKYRLWVNGKYIGSGPARGKAANPYYDTHKVQLQQGENVIAFLVQHYFKETNLYESVEPGLICEIESDGRTIAATDRTWKTKLAHAYSPISGIFFPECFDAQLEEPDWYMADFDDSGWKNAIEKHQTKLAPGERLIPRPIPLLKEKPIAPEKILRVYLCQIENIDDFLDKEKIAETLWHAKIIDRPVVISPDIKVPCKWKKFSLQLEPKTAICVVLDFGFETLAYVEFCIKGTAGTIVDFSQSECLWDNRVATLWQSPSCKQAQRILLRDGTTSYRTNQPRGFRYMVVRFFNPQDKPTEITVESIKGYEAIYPVEKNGFFKCSDRLLEEIYKISARTVNLCMEDAYTDCPWRERSQWIGDMHIEALVNYYCFGAYDLSKKAILEITSSNTEEGWVPGVCPGAYKKNLPTWAMRIPVIVWEYYLFTGDFETLKKAYPGVKKQMQWLLTHTAEDGFYDLKEGWNFVDWTCLDELRADGAVQGWFLESLIYAEKIAKTLKDFEEAKNYAKKAKVLKNSIAKFYWSRKNRAFKKYKNGSPKKPSDASDEILSQHENFLFYLLEIGTKEQRESALNAIAGIIGNYLPNTGDFQSGFLHGRYGNYIGEDIIKINTPFWSFYALVALLKAKKYEIAINYIRHCWGLMLEFGATSCWEMWDRHTSLCHGWSAGPAIILPAYILGVKPLEPGFKKFLIEPELFDLEKAQGSVPTFGGQISISWELKKDLFKISVQVPENLSGVLIPPEGFVPEKKILLKAGKHIFNFKRR